MKHNAEYWPGGEAPIEHMQFIDAAIDALLDAFLLFNLEGRVVHWNRAVNRITGYSDDEITSMTAEDFIAEEDREPLFLRMAEAITGNADLPYAATVITIDGMRIPFEFSGTLLRDGEGEPLGFCAIGRDISTRVVARIALEEQVHFMQALIDAIPNPVFFKDTNGVFVGCNAAFEEFSGLPQTEIAGKAPEELLPEEMARVYAEKDSELFDFPGAQVYESTVVSRDGEMRDVIINKATYCDVKGHLAGLVGVIVDITDRKLADEELLTINRELHGYAHTVSHDLKGPLSVASLACETLVVLCERAGSMDDDISGTLELLDRNLGKASDIVKGLLELAEAGRLPADVREIDLTAVARDVATEEATAGESGRTVTANIGELGMLHANPVQMYQLFSNLIRNAVRHNLSPDATISVELVSGEGDEHVYRVSDDGPGIPPDIIDDIFSPFVKGDSDGAGIGLAIVDKIVRTYGGEITVKNDDGACFEFVLKDVRVN